ncbi:hypothetical protein H4R35_004354 [Dimargaris xerosporica]|nr:hypothetical protein H4R35_004354 [Dimargaris xerosporica]
MLDSGPCGAISSNTDIRRWLRPDHTYSIGRRGCDILLSKDTSISRHHADLIVGACDLSMIVHTNYYTPLAINDANSRFGTFVDGETIAASEPFEVTASCTLTFGAQKTPFALTWQPVIVRCSGMRATAKAQLFHALHLLDFRTSTDANQHYTYLVAQRLHPTQKALLALVAGCQIISDQWVHALATDVARLRALELRLEFPDTRDLFPLPANPAYFEARLHPTPPADKLFDPEHWQPLAQRHTVWHGWAMVTIQADVFAQLHPLVEAGGGTLVLKDTVVDPEGVAAVDQSTLLAWEIAHPASQYALVLPTEWPGAMSTASRSNAARHRRELHAVIRHRLGWVAVSEEDLKTCLILGHTRSLAAELAQGTKTGRLSKSSSRSPRATHASPLSALTTTTDHPLPVINSPPAHTSSVTTELHQTPPTAPLISNVLLPDSDNEPPAIDTDHGYDTDLAGGSSPPLLSVAQTVWHQAMPAQSTHSHGLIQVTCASLVQTRPMPLASVGKAGDIQASSSAPNFKRFHKTRHIFELKPYPQ